MPDIALRLNKDMLVLSAPLHARLMQQGFDERDMEFIALCESDSVRDALRLETLAGATCLVANTAEVTPARLAHFAMEDRAEEFAEASLGVVRSLNPQHVLVEIGPSGLPLDAASKASLNENRGQYARAARLFADKEFDAFFLNGFKTCDDLKCALMGVRQASDKPVFASVDVADDGSFASGRATMEEALAVMGEYGATVAGVATSADAEAATCLARRMAQASDLPLLVQLKVGKHDPKQGRSTKENPYYCPDVMVEAASRLRAAGVQFLRAVGDVTPAYTGALAAAVAGFDVVLAGEMDAPEAGGSKKEALEELLRASRAEVAAAIKGAN